MFRNRKLLIATKHQKEQVIAPIFEEGLGVNCFIDETFDTDSLGTFTGEVERKLDPVSTAREKCLKAMELSNCDMGIASEGSFGPHPSMYFVTADDEILIFIDRLNGIEVVVRVVSTSTNFNGKQIQNWRDLVDFADQVGFPTHGIILRHSKEEFSEMYKGITDLEKLERCYELLRASGNMVYAETDMRAMYNPTRMKVIHQAAEKLLHKLNSACPNCHMPGFGIVDVTIGLKCGLCGSPTNSVLSNIYVCQHCQHRKEDFYPNNKTMEDPTYCDRCNP